MQHNSSLTAQYRAERGVEDLWDASREAPKKGTEPPLYAEQELGALWDVVPESPEGLVDPGYEVSRGADLWNPASVSRSWEPGVEWSPPGYQLGQSTGARWY